MSIDFAIQGTVAARHGPEIARDRGTSDSAPPAKPKEQASGPSPMNPSLNFDPSTGLVIMEFRDKAGEVSSSIPSKRQIDAYRRGARDTLPTSA